MRRKFYEFNKCEKQWFVVKLTLEIFFLVCVLVGFILFITAVDITQGLRLWIGFSIFMTGILGMGDLLPWTYKKSNFYKKSQKARR